MVLLYLQSFIKAVMEDDLDQNLEEIGHECNEIVYGFID